MCTERTVAGGGLLNLKKLTKGRPVCTIAVMLAIVGVVMIAMAPTAAAAGWLSTAGYIAPQVGWLVNYALTFLIVGVLILAFAGVLYWLEVAEMLMIVFVVIGAVFLILALGGFLIPLFGNLGTGVSCQDGYEWDGSQCVPISPTGYVADWRVTLNSPYESTVHDIASEWPDSPFTALGSISPAGTAFTGSTSTIYVNNVSHRMTIRTTVDTGAKYDDADYYVADGYNLNFRVYLNNPTPAVGGGLQEIPFWVKVSASRMTGTFNNGTTADVFYSDISNGLYLGVGKNVDSGSATHTNDHAYINYRNGEVRDPGTWPTEGKWVNVGTSDGDVDGEWVSAWYVLRTPGGFCDYTDQTGQGVTITVEIGTEPGNTLYKGNTVTWYIDIVAVKS